MATFILEFLLCFIVAGAYNHLFHSDVKYWKSKITDLFQRNRQTFKPTVQELMYGNIKPRFCLELIKILPKIKHNGDEEKRAITDLYDHALDNIEKQRSKIKAMICCNNYSLRIGSFFCFFSYQDYYDNLVTALNNLTAMQKQLQRLKKEETIDFSEVTIKDMVIIVSWVVNLIEMGEAGHCPIEAVLRTSGRRLYVGGSPLLYKMKRWQAAHDWELYYFSQQNKNISPVYSNVIESGTRKLLPYFFCMRQEKFASYSYNREKNKKEETKDIDCKNMYLDSFKKELKNDKNLFQGWQELIIEPWQKELLRSNGITEEDIYQQEVVLLKFPYDSLYQLNAKGCYNPVKKSPYQFNDGTIKSKDNPFLDTNSKRRMVTIGDKQEKISFLPGQIASHATWAFKRHYDQLLQDHQEYLKEKEAS